MKKLILAAVILIVIAVIYVSALALCKAAGDADRQAERMQARRMRELESR